MTPEQTKAQAAQEKSKALSEALADEARKIIARSKAAAAKAPRNGYRYERASMAGIFGR